MPTVLHVLPHAGGGAETYLRLLAPLEGFEQGRVELATARTALAAAPSIAAGYLGLARRMGRADVVHVHGDAALLLVLPLLMPPLGRRPVVWTTHGLHLLRRRPALAPLLRAAMGRTRVTICTSGAEARELTRIAPALEGRLRVVPNGIELPPPPDPGLREQVRAELGLADGELAVLFLGELEQRKGPLVAVAGAERARAAGAAVTLLIAGDGPLDAQVRAHAGEAVRPLGFREDPLRLLSGVDAFVLPSAREGHSFALLEAMAHGVAVVVTDGAGNGEAVGDTGVVVRAGDPDALSLALRELAAGPEHRRALGAAGRERVAREFTPERLRAGVRDAYERALKAPDPAAADASA
jgi:glycosyltransferase involved in cell wall biosynthesis